MQPERKLFDGQVTRMTPAKGATVSDDSERSIGDDEVVRQPDVAEPDEFLESIESTDEPASAADGAGGVGFGRRLVGLVAILLGVLGCLVALFLAFSSLRLLVGASHRADDAIAPVISSFDRLEERIDQADDLIDRQGIEDERVGVLRARVDGLVDISTGAQQSFDAIDGHPIYSLLPADLAPLGDALDRFAASATAIDASMGSSPTVRPASAAAIADELDSMQGSVTDTRDRLDDATSSLRRWLRIGGLLGFLASLWALWAQVTLARRGGRGIRNRPV